jgi:RNA polymerase sigma factor (sigma-70 family)
METGDEMASVSAWLGMLKDGDQDAAAAIWTRYFEQLTDVAKKIMATHPNGVTDEEDLALDTLATVFRRVAAGQLERVNDRQSLWFLLLGVVRRKAIGRLRYEHSAKRDRKRQSELDHEQERAFDYVEALGRPDAQAETRESIELLFSLLDDDEMRKIAALKLEGYNNYEIAHITDWSVATVERRLKIIRTRWTPKNEYEVFGLLIPLIACGKHHRLM